MKHETRILKRATTWIIDLVTN